MRLYVSPENLTQYAARQLDHLFPLGNYTDTHQALAGHIPKTLERLEYCFARIQNKYYQNQGEVIFSPLMTDQYATFLYLLANTLFEDGENRELAARVYALNKALHGLDVFYEVKLPRVFFLVHCIGTVLGRAQYGEYLVIYQGVTVGGNLDYEYPIIGSKVALFSNSSVVGKSVIHDGVLVSARAAVMDCEVPAGQVCFGQHPQEQWKPTQRSVMDHYFIRDMERHENHR